MRAVVITDGELRIEDRATPTPGAGDVVVRIEAAGLNAADLLQRRGFYPAPPGSPVDIPGMELAGIVEEVGPGVAADLIGRRVCALVGGGAQSSHCVVASEHLIGVPDGIDMISAGGFAEIFSTAFDALVTQAHAGAGERVLISGAAGGVGTAAVQLAAARGAVPIAVVRTMSHADELRSLGAHDVVTLDNVAQLEPVDVVIELVGAAHLEHAQRVLAPRARVVIIGVGGGARVELDLLTVMSKRVVLTGSTLRARSRAEKADVASVVTREVVPLWAAGTISVPVAATFLLEEASRAYELFSVPGKFGKVVLTSL